MKVFVLMETELDNKGNIHTYPEVFEDRNDAKARLHQMYHDTVVLGDNEMFEKSDFNEDGLTASVIIKDGAVIMWQVKEVEMTTASGDPEYALYTLKQLNDCLDVMQYNGKEFFSIEKEDGQKFIHIHGYIYRAGGKADNGKNFRNVELTFCKVPLDEFVKGYRKQGVEYVDLLEGDVKQYIGDYTEDEAFDIAVNYYEDTPEPETLSWDEITEDTPGGNYRLR